jgi:hypothetical protein
MDWFYIVAIIRAMPRDSDYDPKVDAALNILQESGRYHVRKIANYKKHSFQVDKTVFVGFYQTIRDVKKYIEGFTITDAVNEAFLLWMENRREWLKSQGPK